MIVHLVLFKFKAGISADDARVSAVAKAMDELPHQIPLIRSWHHGPNRTDDPSAWDYGLEAVFNSRADLEAYFEDTAHLPVVAQWQAIAELRFVDFEV